jgi:hypothetical protein
MATISQSFRATAAGIILLMIPAFLSAGFNASAPKSVRRIFTQLAFVDGILVSYHVLEPGPQNIQAFPMDHSSGKLFRFPECQDVLRPVLDDTAVPSADVNHLVPDRAMRQVFNVTLADCSVQPTSEAEVDSLAISQQSIGSVNAPSVPGLPGSDIPLNEQQSDDELWGPVPNVGMVDIFAGGNLSPQHTQATTTTGIPVSDIQQPEVRRPRISGYAGGRLIFFITYETKNLSNAGLVSDVVEAQWSQSGFPGERPLFFLAYGRAPLPPNGNIPAGSLDSNGMPNDNQAVLNVVRGAPFFSVGDYSPLWKMSCLDGGITPTIGPGAPCGNTRHYQIGQPRSERDVKATGLRLIAGIFRDINCPILGTDVNNDGTFADTSTSQELVQFPDINW